MTTGAIVAIAVAVLVLLLIGIVALALRKRRSDRLREEFGPEYERTIEGASKRRQAEKDLAARKDEHAELTLRPLTPAARERYTAKWKTVQASFVDGPVIAVTEADLLVTQLLAERGYPTDDFETQTRMLSVEHADVLDSYRSAHEAEMASQSQQASTEDLRNAILDFRRVFETVMSESNGDVDPYPSSPLDTASSSRPRR